MPNELVFYTNPQSRGRIVRWMLEEVGQPYRTELLDYATTMKAPAYLAINPMGKVPALRHGETVVTEAAAICAYLADAFPGAGLARRPKTLCAVRTIAGYFLPPAPWKRRPATRRLASSCRRGGSG
jgi:glutathione S-transferase